MSNSNSNSESYITASSYYHPNFEVDKVLIFLNRLEIMTRIQDFREDINVNVCKSVDIILTPLICPIIFATNFWIPSIQDVSGNECVLSRGVMKNIKINNIQLVTSSGKKISELFMFAILLTWYPIMS